MAITLKTINASILEGNEDLEQLNSSFQKWFELQKRNRLDDLEKDRELRKLLGRGGGSGGTGKRGMGGALPFGRKPPGGGDNEAGFWNRILTGLGYGVGGAVGLDTTRFAVRKFKNFKFSSNRFDSGSLSEGARAKFGGMDAEEMKARNAEIARQKLLRAQLAEAAKVRAQKLLAPGSTVRRLPFFPDDGQSILRRSADTTRFNETIKKSPQTEFKLTGGRDNTLRSKLNSIRYVANGQAILEYKNKAGKLKGIRLMAMTPMSGLQPTGPLIKPNTLAFKTVINTGALPPPELIKQSGFNFASAEAQNSRSASQLRAVTASQNISSSGFSQFTNRTNNLNPNINPRPNPNLSKVSAGAKVANVFKGFTGVTKDMFALANKPFDVAEKAVTNVAGKRVGTAFGRLISFPAYGAFSVFTMGMNPAGDNPYYDALHEHVFKAMDAFMAGIKSGKKLKDIKALARKVVSVYGVNSKTMGADIFSQPEHKPLDIIYDALMELFPFGVSGRQDGPGGPKTNIASFDDKDSQFKQMYSILYSAMNGGKILTSSMMYTGTQSGMGMAQNYLSDARGNFSTLSSAAILSSPNIPAYERIINNQALGNNVTTGAFSTVASTGVSANPLLRTDAMRSAYGFGMNTIGVPVGNTNVVGGDTIDQSTMNINNNVAAPPVIITVDTNRP